MRIVSLCPSLTELVFDLGLGQQLVGRTRFCVHPDPEVNSVPSIGGTKNPSIARIVGLRPDIVLMNEEENRIEDAVALAAAGVRCHSSFPRTVAATSAMVRDIAHTLGAGAAGDSIAHEIDTRADAVRWQSRSLTSVSYSYLIWRRPYMAAGGDTFITSMFELAAGRNVFADAAERYPQVTADQLRGADPDVVFLSSEPFPFGAMHIQELAECTGLPLTRFHLVDGEYLSWHGSRTPDGIRYVASVMRAVRSAITARTPRSDAVPVVK